MSFPGPIGFLGYGNMGSAILEGLLGRHVLHSSDVVVYDVEQSRRDAAQRLGVAVVDTARALGQQSRVLLLAVKPQQMDEALAAMRGELQVGTLAISIAAGISIDWLHRRLGEGIHVARVMPNTPALVQAGASGIALDDRCTEEDRALVRTIFEAVGIAEFVEECDIDAVTALSGSGPAYFFRMVECLVEAAVAEGLDRATATRLAAQTLHGAGKLLHTSGEDAGTLRARVTSKGGTTEAALNRFEAGGLPGLVQQAVQAAADRSRELGA